MVEAPRDGLDRMIDLHTHTNESDGTYTPEELITAAVELRLQALAITDHDTLAGYEKAKPMAEKAGSAASLRNRAEHEDSEAR